MLNYLIMNVSMFITQWITNHKVPIILSKN